MITAPARGRINSELKVPVFALAITPAREFIHINRAPLAAASFSVPKPNIIINGTKYIPPPMPTAPAINPKILPSPKMKIHFCNPDNWILNCELSKI